MQSTARYNKSTTELESCYGYLTSKLYRTNYNDWGKSNSIIFCKLKTQVCLLLYLRLKQIFECRKNELPLDKMCLVCEVTKKNKEEVTTAPREGAYVHGLYMEVI